MLVTSYKVYGYYRSSSSLTGMTADEKCRERILAFREMLFRLKAFSQSATSIERLEALDRRIHFLVIDYIRQMWRNKCSMKEIKQQLTVLKRNGLLPLPSKSIPGSIVWFVLLLMFISVLLYEDIVTWRV